MSCKLERRVEFGLEIFTLENQWIRAEILAGKGGDLYSLVWKEDEVDVLHKSDIPLSRFATRDLHTSPLTYYSELFTGGWIDVFPGYAIEGDIEKVHQEDSGPAATIPWTCINKTCSETSASITLYAKLSSVSFAVEKTFIINSDLSNIRIEESILNTGIEPIRYTWVQHAVFGGKLISKDTKIELPASRVFMGRKFDFFAGKPLFTWECSISELPYKENAVHDMRKPLLDDTETMFVVALRDLSEAKYSITAPGCPDVEVKWDKYLFPYIRCWYNSGKNPSVALEPSNHFAGNFEDAFRLGSYSTIDPGQHTHTWIECNVKG